MNIVLIYKRIDEEASAAARMREEARKKNDNAKAEYFNGQVNALVFVKHLLEKGT